MNVSRTSDHDVYAYAGKAGNINILHVSMVSSLLLHAERDKIDFAADPKSRPGASAL